MDKERTSILLERDVVLKLKNLARLTNKSTSFIIREALNSYVAKKAPKKEIGIIGIASSSEYSDIANKKDEYLKGFGED
ncbi:MAG: CopG family transcriptional regulator [Actinobacteria bacterium]|nr:CopG family transcriptional regulator [Actinomycetota bacterium]